MIHDGDIEDALNQSMVEDTYNNSENNNVSDVNVNVNLKNFVKNKLQDKIDNNKYINDLNNLATNITASTAFSKRSKSSFVNFENTKLELKATTLKLIKSLF